MNYTLIPANNNLIILAVVQCKSAGSNAYRVANGWVGRRYEYGALMDESISSSLINCYNYNIKVHSQRLEFSGPVVATESWFVRSFIHQYFIE